MVLTEFIIVGTPRSVQCSSPSKKKWKTEVAQAAIDSLPVPYAIATQSVGVWVSYFYNTGDLDVDNILKPILDAMNGIVYLDDEQVIDILASKRDLAETLSVVDISPVLAAHLAKSPKTDFVFIRVGPADPGKLP